MNVNKTTLILKTILFGLVATFWLPQTTQAQIPDFQWAKGIIPTNPGNITIGDMVMDNSGNIYVTGSIQGTTDFGGTGNVLTAAGSDVFIAKYDAAGNTLWARRAGGTNVDRGYAIATDNAGNVYIGGYFGGTANFETDTLTSVGNEDMFIAKYNASGNIIWTKGTGGASSDIVYGIDVDNSGNIHVTGYFNSTVDFGGTGNSLTTVGPGINPDIFVAKYDASGNTLWAKRAGSANSFDEGHDIAVDDLGFVYLTGSFEGTKADFGDGDSLTSSGNKDVFIAKYSASGNTTWAKRIGGTGSDIGRRIAVDNLGHVYIAGSVTDTVDFGGSGNSPDPSGSLDMFVAKYDTSGTTEWVRRAGGTDSDRANGIAVDSSGNISVTGLFNGIDVDFGGGNTLTSTGSLQDAFIVKYNGNGNTLWAKASAGNDRANGVGIAIDNSGGTYVAGSFTQNIILETVVLDGSSNATSMFGSTIFLSNGFVTKLSNSISGLLNPAAVYTIDISIYPNPAQDFITLEAEAGSVYEITTLTGQTLMAGTVQQAREQIATNGLTAGMYLIKVSNDKGMATQKLIVE